MVRVEVEARLGVLPFLFVDIDSYVSKGFFFSLYLWSNFGNWLFFWEFFLEEINVSGNLPVAVDFFQPENSFMYRHTPYYH